MQDRRSSNAVPTPIIVRWVLDAGFATEIETRIETAIETAAPVTLASLRARPFIIRLFDRIIWLGSPYL